LTALLTIHISRENDKTNDLHAFYNFDLEREPMREFGRKGFSVHAKETEIALGQNFENFFKNRIS
jgi:hypothetical protein